MSQNKLFFEKMEESHKNWILFAVLHLIRVDNRITEEEKECLRILFVDIVGKDKFNILKTELELQNQSFTPVPEFSLDEKFNILCLFTDVVISDESVHPEERSLMVYIGKLFGMNRSDINSLIHVKIRQKKVLQELASLQDRFFKISQS